MLHGLIFVCSRYVEWPPSTWNGTPWIPRSPAPHWSKVSIRNQWLLINIPSQMQQTCKHLIFNCCITETRISQDLLAQTQSVDHLHPWVPTIGESLPLIRTTDACHSMMIEEFHQWKVLTEDRHRWGHGCHLRTPWTFGHHHPLTGGHLHHWIEGHHLLMNEG